MTCSSATFADRPALANGPSAVRGGSLPPPPTPGPSAVLTGSLSPTASFYLLASITLSFLAGSNPSVPNSTEVGTEISPAFQQPTCATAVAGSCPR